MWAVSCLFWGGKFLEIHFGSCSKYTSKLQSSIATFNRFFLENENTDTLTIHATDWRLASGWIVEELEIQNPPSWCEFETWVVISTYQKRWGRCIAACNSKKTQFFSNLWKASILLMYVQFTTKLKAILGGINSPTSQGTLDRSSRCANPDLFNWRSRSLGDPYQWLVFPENASQCLALEIMSLTVSFSYVEPKHPESLFFVKGTKYKSNNATKSFTSTAPHMDLYSLQCLTHRHRGVF